MDAWIYLTLAAGLALTLRFMLQKVLAGGRLSAAGATFARFVYSAPLVALVAFTYSQATAQVRPGLSVEFWAYAMVGGVSQILATILVVLLFSHRNFAVGITFKKTEVLLSVIVSALVLGEGVSAPGLVAILMGLVGVILLSDPPGGGPGTWLRRIANRPAGLGLASGLFFAISGVGYRGASLSLSSGDAFQRAIVTLAFVTAFQTIVLGTWLLLRRPGEIGRVFRSWRVSSLVGLTSMAGSTCLFTAFTLQKVGYVNAVGQVELIFSLLASALVFRETISRRELLGVGILGLSIVMLVLVT
ncbi:DMT family transporter [Pelagovum pacificum]|uniref:EamA/RhaT family transporter n=1 Tax=Pelagovum pacificum TaxID=2588711 RepID=A0A5C5GEQ2_9RHOB|nr:DMT family transporter [Pelagovum pacificum]QQA43647.1 EamA family transporter [Pelagovum pacificum]TNY33218.1 EamA/RhaT family transporter [Pelagovum pacificum]